LHVIRGTVLERAYRNGEYKPLTFEEYVSIAADVLELLPSDMVIQRLTGEAPKDILVAPEWTLNKQRVLTDISKELQRRDSRQGKRVNRNTEATITPETYAGCWKERSG